MLTFLQYYITQTLYHSQWTECLELQSICFSLFSEIVHRAKTYTARVGFNLLLKSDLKWLNL